MKRPAVTIAGVFLLLSSPALGQRLSDRFEHVSRQRAQATDAPATRADMLKVLTRTTVTVQFSETPARDAFRYLARVADLHIVGRYADDRVGYGIDPETPITLDAFAQPPLTVIELVLDQCEDLDPCTWQLRNGYVEVGTKDRLAAPSAREIRYYPLRDLLFEPPAFDNAPELDGGGRGGMGGGGGGRGGGGGGGLVISQPYEPPERVVTEELADQLMDLIIESIEPAAWDDNGGAWASIHYHSGTLIVRAPDFIHRQIGGYR
jgi:uncharacterized membrane protein YgcG